jgi:hypothetical protein
MALTSDSNSIIISNANDILGIEKYKLLFENVNFVLVPEQEYRDKTILSEFEYKCTKCDFELNKTLSDLACYLDNFPKYRGCPGCMSKEYLKIIKIEIDDRINNPPRLPNIEKKVDKYVQYIELIETHCNRKFIDWTKDGHVFECNMCKDRKAIVNLKQLADNKNACGNCTKMKKKYTFDDIVDFVKKTDLKLEMTKEEYTSAEKIKVSCKHGVIMTKTLRNIKDNKGCATLCKEEKRLATKNMKKQVSSK